jgi:outer membrane lipoprotein SlyB
MFPSIRFVPQESRIKEADVNYHGLRENLARTLTTGLLVFFLALPSALSASGREGARLVVAQSSGIQKGELIGVNDHALVLSTERGDQTIEVAQIESVRIVKKANKVAAAVGFGIVGGPAGLGLAYASGIKSKDIGGGLAIGVGAIAIGALAGVVAGILLTDSLVKDEVLVFKGRSDGEVKEMLTRLRGQARVTDYR